MPKRLGLVPRQRDAAEDLHRPTEALLGFVRAALRGGQGALRQRNPAADPAPVLTLGQDRLASFDVPPRLAGPPGLSAEECQFRSGPHLEDEVPFRPNRQAVLKARLRPLQITERHLRSTQQPQVVRRAVAVAPLIPFSSVFRQTASRPLPNAPPKTHAPIRPPPRPPAALS